MALRVSASVTGPAIGLAARLVLSHLRAGIRRALTQPMRLEDVVIAQNEGGEDEEMPGAYAVVRI